jgi:membrane-bound metal-dependent hydrolase YbcI (DUF457 family)
MVAGHFGFAAAVKARARGVPLWALMLATVWLDIVFVPLLLAGVERLDPVAGAKAGAYGGAIIHADYTHSLVGAVVLALVFALPAALRYGRRAGIVLAAVVFSHWLLDLPMHRGDMPLLPGGAGALPRLGFGLWRYPLPSALLELAVVVAGAVMYWRAARRAAGADAAMVRRAHRCGAAVLVAGLLTLVLNVAGA